MGEPGTSSIVPAVNERDLRRHGKRLRKLPVDPAQLKASVSHAAVRSPDGSRRAIEPDLATQRRLGQFHRSHSLWLRL